MAAGTRRAQCLCQSIHTAALPLTPVDPPPVPLRPSSCRQSLSSSLRAMSSSSSEAMPGPGQRRTRKRSDRFDGEGQRARAQCPGRCTCTRESAQQEVQAGRQGQVAGSRAQPGRPARAGAPEGCERPSRAAAPARGSRRGEMPGFTASHRGRAGFTAACGISRAAR